MHAEAGGPAIAFPLVVEKSGPSDALTARVIDRYGWRGLSVSKPQAKLGPTSEGHPIAVVGGAGRPGKTQNYTSAPKRAPAPAVTPIASAPQNVTRMAPGAIRAPPVHAASAPSAPSTRSDAIATA